MWDSIAKPWQIAFLEGWKAFVNGSIPIGAVIIDENGTVISKGRNRIYENTELNPIIAHAEVEALRKLDVAKFPNCYQYTLYTCMEPCPMCMGTIVMSHFRKVRIAARDRYCGAAHYCIDDSYIASKKMQVDFEKGLLETVQLTLQTYWEFKRSKGEVNHVIEKFLNDNPCEIEIAREFYNNRYLDLCVEKNVPFSEIFNQIVNRFNTAK